MKIAILGLTITSSWGNGHATTFRSLCRALHARGHRIDFLEKDVEWYRSNRDLPEPEFCTSHLYENWAGDGEQTALAISRDADVVVIGSYFPDGIAAAGLLFGRLSCPVLFYDIDTPITVAGLRARGATEYLRAADIPRYAAYLSFTGGPMLEELRTRFGSPHPVPLYCSVDPAMHHRTPPVAEYAGDLAYLGTYAPDRQPKLMELLNRTASRLPESRFLVAGPQYPAGVEWAANVERLVHLSPPLHSAFYSSSRFALNLTRKDMVEAGWSPSVRLFEASACGAAILSDSWPGLESFLCPGSEILLAASSDDVARILREISVAEQERIGRAARERVLAEHTSAHRATEFESIVGHIG